MIEHVERERTRQGRPPIAYEVGTEEVHGGLVDYDNFARFLAGLRQGLAERGLAHIWPCFIVGKVGTDINTSYFDPEAANHLYGMVAPMGSLIKGHYSDWVANPKAYPQTGMGGANFGPELTVEEYLALADLSARETDLQAARGLAWCFRTSYRPYRTPSLSLIAGRSGCSPRSAYPATLAPFGRP